MAKCAKCGKEVGCGCNLLNGKCHVCFNEGLTPSSTQETTERKRDIKRVVYQKAVVDPPPNTEFEQILKTKGLSKEEKIKRINNILEKARKDAAN